MRAERQLGELSANYVPQIYSLGHCSSLSNGESIGSIQLGLEYIYNSESPLNSNYLIAEASAFSLFHLARFPRQEPFTFSLLS